MSQLLNSIFNAEFKFQKLLLNLNISILWCIPLFISVFIIQILNFSQCVTTFFIYTIFILIFVIIFIHEANKTLTTIFGFAIRGLFYAFLFSILILALFETKFHYNNFVEYIVITITSCIVWAVFSTLANANVSKLVNEIFSSMVGVVVFFNSFIWKILTIDGQQILSSNIINEILKVYNLSEETLLSILTYVFTLPLFLIFLIGSIASDVKKYWINKYNSGQDI